MIGRSDFALIADQARAYPVLEILMLFSIPD
jgi:hypothetical protein